MRKHTMIIILMLIMAIIITACKTPSEKSAKEIQTDIASSDWYVHNYPGYVIQEVEIVKRQTDRENLIDKVFVVATIMNEDESILGNLDVLLEYGLYNDGWIMDSCEINYEGQNHGCNFYPRKELNLSDEEIAQVLTNFTGSAWENVTVYAKHSDLDAGTAEFSLTASETHKYMEGFIDATIGYYFAGSMGYWMPFLTINAESEVWHIEGRYYDATYNRYLDIRDNGHYIIDYEGWDSLWGQSVCVTKHNEFRQKLTPYGIGINELFANYAYDTPSSYRRDVKNGYQVEIHSDFGFNYYDCEYVAFDSYGDGEYEFLFIGKDFIATKKYRASDDDYNKIITIDVFLLEKIS